MISRSRCTIFMSKKALLPLVDFLDANLLQTFSEGLPRYVGVGGMSSKLYVAIGSAIHEQSRLLSVFAMMYVY